MLRFQTLPLGCDTAMEHKTLCFRVGLCSRAVAVCTIWYMFTEDSIEIGAPAELVWQIFSDVERWPEWTSSVTTLVGLDGSVLAIGRRFRIKQPGMSKLVWQVTEIEPGASWTWVQRSPGVRVSARHDISAQPGGRTLVRQQLDQRGVLGAPVGRLMAKKTKRFLELEAQGLKARSEQLSRADGSHA
jgi:uncharacterized membrane protein